MRCDECQTDPYAEGNRCCECCGRPLPVHVRMSAPRVESAPLATGTVRAASAPRCESCGGPSDQGDLCASCRQAFETVLAANAGTGNAAAPAAPEPAAQTPEPQSKRLSKWGQTADTLAGEIEEPWTLSMQVAWELERWPQPQPAADVEAVPTVPEGQLRLTFDDDASNTPAIAAPERDEPATDAVEEIDDVPVVAALRKTFAKSAEEPVSQEADAAPSPEGRATPARVLAPAFAKKAAQPAAPAVRTPSRAVTTATAALVVVAAVGFPVLTRLRAGAAPEPTAVVAEAPAPAAPKPAAAETPAPEPPAPVKTEPERPVVPPAAKPRTDRANNRSRSKPQPPKLVLPAPRPPEAAPSPAPVAVAEPVAEAPPPPPRRESVAPVGPFYEMRDVHVPPQVVSRVEPVVPASVAGPVDEILVVRVLVSQTGQPSMARLLRASKTGPAIDNAVIQAVHRWTFTPAQRRGMPVSCWYHTGVQVRSR